jgi:uncharacterized protein YjdB
MMPVQQPLAVLTTSLCAVLSLFCVDGESDISGPRPVASLTVHPTTATLEPGQTLKLTPVLRDVTGSSLGDRTVDWTTSDPGIATVSSAGLVTGTREGSAGITAAAEAKSATARISVQIPVATVEIKPASPTIAVGSSIQLGGWVTGPGGIPIAGRVFHWSSSDTSVATVSAGKVWGRGQGLAVITATAGSRSGTTTVTVESGILQTP